MLYFICHRDPVRLTQLLGGTHMSAVIKDKGMQLDKSDEFEAARELHK